MSAPRALIIGGTGQIGHAAAGRLTAGGWSVTLASRSGAGHGGLRLDRDDTDALLAAARGHDLVVDVVAYTAAHAAQLTALAGDIGALVVISSGAVYAGAEEGVSGGLPVPVPEDWPLTSEQGGYAGGKAELERVLLAAPPDLPVSILRPGTLHGPHSTSLHQWSFIKPALDRRPCVVLAYDGLSRFSTSAVANVAELIALCARTPGTRVPPRDDGLGFNPWGVPSDMVLDGRKAREELGYSPVVCYNQALQADIDWAVEAVSAAEAAGKSWHDVFPGLVGRFGTACWFPYDAEDAYVHG
jgi:nucleoside-diphosphate-sugar epimerase